MKIDVLDHGFVELVDAMGSDKTVVNSARVSFGKRITEVGKKDERLIKYLADNKHYSPFRHVQLQFHCKVPEFLARQWYKHIVGITYSEMPTVDHAWNEISMRYADASDFNFYKPSSFRAQATDSKQASVGGQFSPEEDERLEGHYARYCRNAVSGYKHLVACGVAKEQARCVLPLSIYTEFYWTASLQAVANFVRLRKHPHAQFEIQDYGFAVEQLAMQVAPLSVAALLGT